MMRQKKDEFRCVYEFETVYVCLTLSIGSFCLAIIMVLMMLIEQIFGITVALCVIFGIVSIITLIVSLIKRDKKFVINQHECKVESKKGTSYIIPLHSIRRIVDVEASYGRRIIVIDCEEYPFLMPQYIPWKKAFYIKYTSRRLKNIRKFCPYCPIDRERTNYFTIGKRD